MKLPRFESDYSPAEVPAIDGNPMPNSQLTLRVNALAPWRRIEGSQQTLLLDAVESFYLAKRFWQAVPLIGAYTNAIAQSAVTVVAESLMRLAVIAVAAVNDRGRDGRTRSLPHTLDAVAESLNSVTSRSVSTELAAIRAIKASIDPEAVLSLKYLRHVRNKWAGHASLDRSFDGWADADESLSLPLIEDALVRLVTAHQDFSDLVTNSAVLQHVTKSPANPKSDVIPMGVAWDQIVPLANVVREWAGKAAEALVDQLQSPPGYGGVEDRDVGPGSEHDSRRRAIDEAVGRFTAGTAQSSTQK